MNKDSKHPRQTGTAAKSLPVSAPSLDQGLANETGMNVGSSYTPGSMKKLNIVQDNQTDPNDETVTFDTLVDRCGEIGNMG